jgi:hypothetical protein
MTAVLAGLAAIFAFSFAALIVAAEKVKDLLGDRWITLDSSHSVEAHLRA